MRALALSLDLPYTWRMSHRIRVGIIQAAPVYLDLAATMEKLESLIRQGAADGARVLACGETWLTGYPTWLDHYPGAAFWNHDPVKDTFARHRQNSIVVPGPETDRLAALTGELGVALVLGVNERVQSGPGNGTLYNSMLIFDGRGQLALHHRKLVPTYTERIIWGPGDGHGLHSVATAAGRLSGLICWEHWMPLPRQALHECGEDIHVALWPTVHDIHQLASRHYALEGRCFVLAVGLLMDSSHIPLDLGERDDSRLLRGGSAIIAPDGRYVLEPTFDEEAILTAEIDLHEIDREAMTLDVTGHYARPDVLQLSVDRRRRSGSCVPSHEDLPPGTDPA